VEKVFQFSFVYSGSLFANVAGTKTEAIADLSMTWHVPPFVLVSMGLLLLNLMYLVIACRCVSAVVKRGYFILTYGDSEQTDALPQWVLRAKRDHFGYLSWNVDNYCFVVLYALVFVISVLLFWYASHTAAGLLEGA
jgi:hypothetical protein